MDKTASVGLVASDLKGRKPWSAIARQREAPELNRSKPCIFQKQRIAGRRNPVRPRQMRHPAEISADFVLVDILTQNDVRAFTPIDLILLGIAHPGVGQKMCMVIKCYAVVGRSLIQTGMRVRKARHVGTFSRHL
jgi:hypothetical protein